MLVAKRGRSFLILQFSQALNSSAIEPVEPLQLIPEIIPEILNAISI